LKKQRDRDKARRRFFNIGWFQDSSDVKLFGARTLSLFFFL
jgi:hypothetical protein